jgi:hypothetical protein
MMEFDWEQEGYKRLHHLERENVDLRREIAYLREYLREKEWEIAQLDNLEARHNPPRLRLIRPDFTKNPAKPY